MTSHKRRLLVCVFSRSQPICFRRGRHEKKVFMFGCYTNTYIND